MCNPTSGADTRFHDTPPVQSIPPLEHPTRQILLSCARAYLSGYAFDAFPKIITLLIKLISGRRHGEPGSSRQILLRLLVVVASSLKARLPFFMLTLIGGFRVLDRLAWKAVKSWKAHPGITPKKVSIAVSASVMLQPTPEGDEMEQLVFAIDGPPSVCSKDALKSIVPAPYPMVERILNPTVFAATVSSALALLIIEPARRAEFALFTLVRAMDSAVSFKRASMKWTLRNRFGVPDLVLNNASAIVFITACTQIMFCWFYYPQALPRSYTNWITSMSHLHPRVKQAFALFGLGEMQYGEDTGHAHVLGEVAEELGYGFGAGDPVNGHVSCGVIHNKMGCLHNFVQKWRAGMRDSLKIYLLVHLLPVLLFNRKRLRSSRRAKTITDIITGTLRSANFLATFVTFVWIPLCTVRNLTKRDGMLGPFLGSLLSGFSIFLERPSRRREMAVYVVPKALDSLWWRLANGRLGLGRLPGAEFVMFAAGMSYIFSAVTEPVALRPAIRNALGFFLTQ
ncbi:hypothetical protein PhCBS80983_g04460 [Powellomyces hirtus]|uniref:Transmembrane protein 135 N-terminal domain-containing protein n=1 Tax=Powellomyces hirtus TaxID=109895 RepID=A0A507DYU8_9FUNG|nr:hypothetical protein PhCBS80983_g04460 [Powellomyces hirtus]